MGWILNSLGVAEERISELETMTVKAVKLKSKEKTDLKKKNRISKNYAM